LLRVPLPVPVNNFAAHLIADMSIAEAQNAMPNAIAIQVEDVRDAANQFLTLLCSLNTTLTISPGLTFTKGTFLARFHIWNSMIFKSILGLTLSLVFLGTDYIFIEGQEYSVIRHLCRHMFQAVKIILSVHEADYPHSPAEGRKCFFLCCQKYKF
jgi:hypothetical protein